MHSRSVRSVIADRVPIVLFRDYPILFTDVVCMDAESFFVHATSVFNHKGLLVSYAS